MPINGRMYGQSRFMTAIGDEASAPPIVLRKVACLFKR